MTRLNDISILGPTLRFKGELRAEEDLVIRGQVDGHIVHSQKLTIGHDGHVKADIQGEVITVEGTVEGDLSAGAAIAILEGANVTGDVRAPSISIVEGANFNGNVFMETSRTPRSSRKAEASV